MKDLIEKTYILKEELQKDPRIIALNELDKEMSNNDEVILLAFEKDKAIDKLNDLLKIYKDDSNEVNKARKLLSEKQKALGSHPLVMSYNKAYQQVRELYNYINEELFSFINIDLCHKKEVR